MEAIASIGSSVMSGIASVINIVGDTLYGIGSIDPSSASDVSVLHTASVDSVLGSSDIVEESALKPIESVGFDGFNDLPTFDGADIGYVNPDLPTLDVGRDSDGAMEELQTSDVNNTDVIEEVPLGEDTTGSTDNSSNNSMMTNLVPVGIPGFGGDGGSSKAAQDALEAEGVEEVQVVLPDAPAISFPADGDLFATTTIVFSGTASSAMIISQDFSSATTTVSSDESWSLSLSSLLQGTTTVTFVATDSDGASSESVFIDIFVDTVAPVFGSFSVLECTYSLRAGGCLSGGTNVNLAWTSTSSDILYYAIMLDSSVYATTTDTSATSTLADKTSTNIEIVAYDMSGNIASSSLQTMEVFVMPVVINEVAWAGTQASPSDEWIELYNRTSYTVDMSSVVLYAEDFVPYISLSGSIPSGGYYFIERTDGNTTSEAEDLAVAFSGLLSGSGLSNSGEKLSLVQSLGGVATTTLDVTPEISSCGGWCGGEATTTPITMERMSTKVSGSDTSNWSSNNTFTKNGTDADGNNIYGTPGSQNSIDLLPIGYYCPPELVTYISGNYYTPSGVMCMYLSESFPSGSSRYGDTYKGVVASSTLYSGHLLSTLESSIEQDSYTGAVQGDDYFTVVYQLRNNFDLTTFRNYFQTGSVSPPHLYYGILEWKYGVTP